MTDMEWQTIGRNVRPQTKLLFLWWLIYPIKLAEKPNNLYNEGSLLTYSVTVFDFSSLFFSFAVRIVLSIVFTDKRLQAHKQRAPCTKFFCTSICHFNNKIRSRKRITYLYTIRFKNVNALYSNKTSR